MPRRLRTTETTDAFSEFLAEHPGLWPPRQSRGDGVDPFSEFETEGEPVDDRWLTAARGRQSTPRMHDYRHMLAVASVLVSVFMPAGVISTFIVGRALTVSPMHALPPLPEGLLEASVDRIMGVPAVQFPSPPERSAESRSTAPPPLPRPPQTQAPPAPASAATAPITVLPLTSALLSTPVGSDVRLAGAPPPVRSNPAAPAPVTAGVASALPPAAAPSPGTAAPPRPSVPNTPTESSAVRAVLDRYRLAFSTLDASGAKSVWPDVDERALARAFNQMTEQQFVFNSCSIDVTGARATASCQGLANYVPKVGSRTPRVDLRQWTFTLQRAERGWTIESVDSR